MNPYTKELIQKAQKGDQESKDELISLNLGLVWSIVKRFNNRGYELEDLFQIGSIGLLKAIKKFDFTYDVKFSTYAVPMIMGEIRRYIRDNQSIKVSRSLRELSFKIQKKKEYLQGILGREPTITELAEKMQVCPEDIVVAMEASKDPVSLDDIVVNNDDGSPLYRIDQIDSDTLKENNWFDRLTLKEALSKLDKEERQIIILRYFKDMTQSETANALNMTQVQISRKERKILNKIRHIMSL